MMKKKSIIEWVEIKEYKDLPPRGEYLVRYDNGLIKYMKWIPKIVPFDFGWFDSDGDSYLPPRYYCKLKDITDYEI